MLLKSRLTSARTLPTSLASAAILRTIAISSNDLLNDQWVIKQISSLREKKIYWTR